MVKNYGYKFPVRNSGLNPFITNPVWAVESDPNEWGRLKVFFIGHAINTDQGLIVIGNWQDDDKETQYNLTKGTMRIANLHEADRFDKMLKMLGIKLG